MCAEQVFARFMLTFQTCDDDTFISISLEKSWNKDVMHVVQRIFNKYEIWDRSFNEMMLSVFSLNSLFIHSLLISHRLCLCNPLYKRNLAIFSLFWEFVFFYFSEFFLAFAIFFLFYIFAKWTLKIFSLFLFYFNILMSDYSVSFSFYKLLSSFCIIILLIMKHLKLIFHVLLF